MKPVTSPSSKASVVMLIASLIAVGLVACQSGSSNKVDQKQQQSQESKEQPRVAVRFDPPASLAILLSPRALPKAQMSLDEVIESLPAVDFLDTKKETDSTELPDAPPDAVKVYIKARMLIREHKEIEATKLLKQVIQQDPNAAQAWQLLGLYALKLGNQTQAIEYLKKAVELDPLDLNSVFQIGRLVHERKQYDQTIVLLGHAFKNLNGQANDPALKYLVGFYLGKALLLKGYDQAAVAPHEKFLLAPDRPDYSSRYLRAMFALARRKNGMRLQLCDLLVRLGKFSQAREQMQILAQTPNIKSELLLPRQVYLDLCLGLNDQSQQLILDKMDWANLKSVQVELITYYAKHATNRDAFLDQLQKRYRNNQYPEQLGLLLSHYLNEANQLTFLKKHLEHKPQDFKIFQWVQDQLSSSEPIAALEIAIESIHNNSDYALRYVRGLLKNRQTRKLLDEQFEQVTDSLKNSAAGFYVKGKLSQSLAKIDAAEKAFAQSLDADPDFVAARVAAVELVVARGQSDQAIKMIGQLTDQSPPRMRYLLAVAYQLKGQAKNIAKARQLIDELLGQFPDNTEYMNRKAVLQIRQRDFTGAEVTLKKAITADPTFEPAYRGLFTIYESINPDARKYVLLLTQLKVTLPYGRLTRLKTARLFVLQKQPEKAEQILSQLLTENSSDVEVLKVMILLLQKLNRLPEALPYLRKALDDNPNNGNSLELMRQVALQLKQSEAFFPYYEKFLLTQKQSPEQLVRLEQLYSQQKQYDKAIDVTQKALASDSDNTLAHLVRLAQLYQLNKQPKLAIQSIDQAITKTPDKVLLYIVKAELLIDHEQSTDAESLMRDTIKRFPDQAMALRFEMIRLYNKMKQTDKAIAEINLLIGESSADRRSDLLYYKSNIYTLAGKEDLAEQTLVGLLKTNPDHAPANNDLGYSWADRGIHLDQALKMTEKAAKAQPKNAAYLDSLGWVYYKRGRFNHAVTLLVKAVNLPDGREPTLLDHLGDAMWMDGKKLQAVTQWEAALKLVNKAAGAEAERYKEMKLGDVLLAKLQAYRNDKPPDVAPVPAIDLKSQSTSSDE